MANVVGTIKGYHGGAKTIANIFDSKQTYVGQAKILMHFDSSVTTDAGGNSWAAIGSKVLSLNPGSCVVASSQSNFNIGTTFTIEAWIYPRSWTSAVYSTYAFPIFSRWAHGSSTLYALNVGGNGSTTGLGSAVFFVGSGSGSGGTSSVESEYCIPLNQWSHIAASRDSSNVVRLFINGALVKYATISNSVYNNSSYPTTIGASSSKNVWADGYISDVRLSNICRYTSNFSPAARGSMAKDSYTQSLLKFTSSTTYDECGNTWTSYGSPTCESVLLSGNVKFGAKSLAFATANSGVVCNSHNAYIGTQPFTVDWWEYVENRDTARWRTRFDFVISSGSTQVGSQFACAQPVNASYTSFCLDANGKRIINYPSNVFPVTYGTWMHRAITRDRNNVLRCFSNGTKTYETTFAYSIENKTKVYIGNTQADSSNNLSTYSLPGCIDEFRVVVGKAMWTANFTPPSSPYALTTGAVAVNGNLRIRHNNANCYVPLTNNKSNTATPCLAVRHGSTNFYSIK